jgi:hypothetical protein
MGRDALKDSLDEFVKDIVDIVVIGVKADKTVYVKTSIYDKEEFQAVLTTAILMSVVNSSKFGNDGVDTLQ